MRSAFFAGLVLASTASAKPNLPAPSCEEMAIGPVEAWGVQVGAPELAPHAQRLVNTAVRASCNTGWDDAARRCFARERDRVGKEYCTSRLDADTSAELRMALALVSTNLSAMQTRMTRPETITCHKVAAAHYEDGWSRYVPKEPHTMTTRAVSKIAIAARAAMASACKKEAWSAADRACIVTYAAGPNATVDDARFACFDDAAMRRWQYPPAAVVATAHTCGKAVTAAVAKHYSSPVLEMLPLALAQLQARITFTLLAACDARKWTAAQRSCLARGGRIERCTNLAPADALWPALSDARFEDGEGLPRP